MKYLRLFETTAAYDAAKDNLDLPNVSYCEDNNEVHYNPFVPMNIITYEASTKLPETTSSNTAGLHTNAFNTTIKSHTFENGVGTIEFNADVTSIGYQAFYKCYSLTSIEMPSSVTSIDRYVFYECNGLTNLNSDVNGVFNIPDGVTSIGSGAFYQCTGLTSITIPSGVTSIGDSTFLGCTSLTSVIIPNGIPTIDMFVFYKCSSLTSITCNATTAPTIQSNTFQDIKTGGTLYVPTGSTGYDVWMGTGNYYLGKYNWTKVEQ